MAGYIFGLDSVQSLNLYTQNGVYSTKLSAPSGTWQVHHEGTFADYATMRPGDNVYFFIKRKIYGIGKLVAVGSDCKYFNFPGAGHPQTHLYEEKRSELLWDEGIASINHRCLCLFEPDPHFFIEGIDMDDVLSSNPLAFKMLRAFWKLSFIKFDDEENQAFRDILLKRNQNVLTSPIVNLSIFPFQSVHESIKDKVDKGGYSLQDGMQSVLASCQEGTTLRHEMAIEAGLLHQLAVKEAQTCSVFGMWDYLSHQVIASPLKPIDYMDKMDIFGYAYIPQFRPTQSRFLVGEIKKSSAAPTDIDQLLKYVDWVCDEYCFGDYSMIHAFLIASHFDKSVIQHKDIVGARQYTVGVRPAQSFVWSQIKLIRYSFTPLLGRISFDPVTH